MLIYSSIENLLTYAEAHLMLDELNVVYCRNLILDELKLTDYTEYQVDYDAIDELDRPDTVIEPIVNYAVENGVIPEEKREYFAAKILNIVSLRPGEVTDTFQRLHEKNPVKAFEWLHDYCIKNNYIKYTQIQKNRKWEAKSTKGKLEITINTSRPEKNNKDLVKLLDKKANSGYPKCTICKENEGLALGDTVRQTLRTIPLELGGEEWFWQFSPYAYFNQHGIAVNREHVPMVVDSKTIERLFDFVDYMPGYFIGCNAALPRVGGSILNHDHFQGGKAALPMHKAQALKKIKSAEYPYIDACVVDWYNSVIRLSSTNREKMIEFACKINDAWKQYSDESVGIIAKSDEQHNAITPILRKTDGKYSMDIIFRNNRCDETYPDGIFHAHPEYMNIKSESIGLIEAMGLFILPGRLDAQLSDIEKYLTKEVRYNAEKLDPSLTVHKAMIEKLLKEAGSSKLSQIEAQLNIKDEINRVCEEILYNTAVFKKDEQGVAAFDKFLGTLDIK